MSKLQIAIESKSYNMKNRELANALHKLESLFYKKSQGVDRCGVMQFELKEIHHILSMLKSRNKTTAERAEAFKDFISNLESIFESNDIVECLSLMRESIYYVIK